MAEDPASVHRGPALVHVQVGPANVRGGDPDEHIGGLYDHRVRNILDADLPGPFVNNSFHDLSNRKTETAPAIPSYPERPTPHCRPTAQTMPQHPVARLPERGFDIFVLPGRVCGAALGPAREAGDCKSSLTGVTLVGVTWGSRGSAAINHPWYRTGD